MVNRVELLVTGQDGVKHYIDLENTNVGINLNYSIDDVRNIEKKNGNFSKTFTVPGTKNNNKIFGYLFNVNSNFSQFNPNLRVDAVLLENSSPLIKGYLQLKGIRKLSQTDLEGNLIKYEIILFDDSIDFFQQLGDKELTDLELSAYTHTYDRTTIENSWTTAHTYADMYQYPLMDKDTTGYNVSDFKPALYSKGLLNKIASEAGYTLEGDFMDNDTMFSNEIIFWDGNTPEISKSEALSREFRAGMTGTTVTLATGTKNKFSSLQENIDTKSAFDYDDVIFDNSGNYLPNDSVGGDAASTWIAPKDGRYTFNIKQNFTLTYSSANDCDIKVRNSLNILVNQFINVDVVARLRYVDNNSVITATSLRLGRFENLSAGVPKSINRDITFKPLTTKVEAGRKIYVEFQLITQSRFAWYGGLLGQTLRNVSITFSANKALTSGGESVFFNNTVLIQNIEYGDDIDLNLFVPKSIKQRNFFADIIKRYNLYIRPNPNKIRTLILETRDKYYSNTEVLDWTYKKDYSSEDQINFLTELQNKEILFTYKNDSSAVAADGKNWGEIYTKSTGDIYGQKKIVFDNDFVKDTKVIESIFTSAPLLYRDKNGVVVPGIKSTEGKRNPVIGYWGGKIPVKDEDGVVITNGLSINWSGTTATYSDYPYAGHYNDPYEPSEDIHFGEVTYENYGILIKNITNNNLFNKYWRNHINQISTGKLITAYFRLTSSDINKIKDNLSYRIFVKDSYYTINKIIDYKPLEDGLTKVELLRIDAGSTFVPTDTPLSAITDNSFVVNSTNVVRALVKTNNQVISGPISTSESNEVYSKNMIVLGENNYVGEGSSGVISGNDNNVGGNSENINIQGNNNVIAPGVSNVTVIGDEQTVTESNTSVINGLTVNPDGSTKTSDSASAIKKYTNTYTGIDITTLPGLQYVVTISELSTTEFATIKNIEILIANNTGSLYPLWYADIRNVIGAPGIISGDFLTIPTSNEIEIWFASTGSFNSAGFTNANITLSFEYTPD